MSTYRRLLVASFVVAGLVAGPAQDQHAPDTLKTQPVAASTNPVKHRFPDHWKAIQSTPAKTRHWALIVGITEYQGPTRNTLAGRQDAVALRQHLRSLGWRHDHILTISDGDATRAMIVGALKWLAWKTNANSTVVFAYAGHEMPFGSGSAMRVGLHTHDNRYLMDTDLGRLLDKVHARKMWIHIATCRAAGFDAPGTIKANRVVTFSSLKSQLSYEDMRLNLSVINHFMVGEGMRRARADADGDGRITVQEAFGYAKPFVRQRTSQRQRPKMINRLGAPFRLEPKVNDGLPA